MTEYRAHFDFEIYFANGGSLTGKGFRLDVPSQGITPDAVETLLVRHLGLTLVGEVRLTGLDDAEWGVTLFARDTFQIKAIVYKMRFDPVSAEYADFGEFYIGIQLPLDELFRRLQL